MNNEGCESCTYMMNVRPSSDCQSIEHWKRFAIQVEDKLEQHDDDRDKLEVAEWLERYEKVKSYNCHGCGRHYEIPTHLTLFACICGHRCRLRHLGGTDPNEAVIDAAIRYFGNERSAQLAWIAEVVAGKHCPNYSADEIRAMIRQEMDRWQLSEDGWRKR